jgi:hypothetical protein
VALGEPRIDLDKALGVAARESPGSGRHVSSPLSLAIVDPFLVAADAAHELPVMYPRATRAKNAP